MAPSCSARRYDGSACGKKRPLDQCTAAWGSRSEIKVLSRTFVLAFELPYGLKATLDLVAFSCVEADTR